MTTIDFITELFVRVDDAMPNQQKHSQARLFPSETVTLGLLFALKGVGNRAFYRWISRDLCGLFPCGLFPCGLFPCGLFPHLPERTRLFRLLAQHQGRAACFLAPPTLLGVADSFGIELLHPWRFGRSDKQIGKKCYSNHRWIVGGKLGVVLNRFGQVCAWDCKTANTHDSDFQPLIAAFDERMLVLTDTHFHQKAGDPPTEGRRPTELEGLQARRLERTHGDRDRAVYAFGRVPLQARGASGLALFRGAAGVHNGRVQPVRWLERVASR